MWILLYPSEHLAEKLELKLNLHAHKRAASFYSFEVLCGADYQEVSLGESLYSLGIILFKNVGVDNIGKRRHELASGSQEQMATVPKLMGTLWRLIKSK